MKYLQLVVLIPIASGDRQPLEHIENQKFDTIEALQNAICFDEDNPMAVEDLMVMTLSEFVDACNDQFINLEEMWVGYIQMKDNSVEVPSEELLGQVVSQIQGDLECSDHTALYELLSFLPVENLKAYLPEE